MKKRMDVELFLATAHQAELINAENFTSRSFDEGDDVISELIRVIIKDRFASTDTVVRMHKNQEGISVSVKNEKIEQCLSFSALNLNNIERSDTEFDVRSFEELSNRLRHGSLHYFNAHTFQKKENRIVFYLKYHGFDQYRTEDYLSFNALFEMIQVIENWEVAASEIPLQLEAYNAHQERIEGIRRAQREELERREAERRAETERLLREREERIRQENEQRLAAQRIEEERIAAQEALNREEYERRQQLLQQGATEGGIDIANQLLEFLGRGNR
jgi:hypothetical protein